MNQWKSTSSFAKLPKWKEELSIWRLSQVKEKSPNCLINGNCIRCGCDTISETFGSKGCQYGCYPDRGTEKEWEQFKKTNKIKQIC